MNNVNKRLYVTIYTFNSICGHIIDLNISQKDILDVRDRMRNQLKIYNWNHNIIRNMFSKKDFI